MPSEGVIISIISSLGGIIAVYLAWILKNKKPKPDRVDEALTIYESIVRQSSAETDRLRSQLAIEIAKNTEKDIKISKLSEELNEARRK